MNTPKMKRLGPGYYYSTTAIVIDGIETHVVIEESDGGSYWKLRLESFPSMTSIHSTKKAARWALSEMINEAGMVLALA